MKDTLKKIYSLITKRERKGLMILSILLFIGMALEVFGLGVLIPAISILLDPEMIEKTPLMVSLKSFFLEFSQQNFIIILLLVIVVVYFFKSLFLVLLTHVQNIFLNNIIANISNNLFRIYLSQPYRFHLKRNASELIKNIQIEINFLNGFLISLITIFIEGGFVISIIAFLIYIEPLGAISIGLFYGILSMAFLQFTKRKLNLWGKERQYLDVQLSKITMEGLGGIKDLIILGKTSYFINQYSNKNFVKARLNAKQGTVSQLPRFYLEFVSIIGLISFIILLLVNGKNPQSLITILGVFVAATFRMIPSLNRIIAAIQVTKYYDSSVDVIFNEINNFEKTKTALYSKEIFTFKKNIEIKNVNFSFHLGNQVLQNINLKIDKGQTIGIIGESGSGKSTLVDLIVGLHKPVSGNIIIDDVDGFQMTKSWMNNIGYVSQTIYLTDDSIKKNIALGVSDDQIDETWINKLLDQVRLKKFINTLEKGTNTRVGERGVQLSGGQRQRIGLARALYHNPDILILDEATSALDTETEKEVMDSINSLKGEKTIIIIAHRLSTIDFVDQTYKVSNSKIQKL